MRYLAHTPENRKNMLNVIGVDSIDDLFKDVPKSARKAGLFDLPMHQHELSVERYFKSTAAKNLTPGDVPSFIGGGLYSHHVPSSVNYLIQRGEFLTSYTPYQPEIAQGTLQYLFEFQTQVATLMGMEVANASMYDGATATAEAVLMANRLTRRNKCVVSGNLHPHYLDVIKTFANFAEFEIGENSLDIESSENLQAQIDDETSCVIVQYPDFLGNLQDYSDLATKCQEKGALLVVVVTEIVSLGLLKSPGEMGADIVVGEGQSIGNLPNFGGPTVGLFATKQKYVRQMPGRVAGQTEDAAGNRGWVLTLSTREQHIRREKATSNICTNSGLCALAFTIHMSLLGSKGLKRLAKLNHAKACQLRSALQAVDGVEVINKTFFNELLIKLSKPAATVIESLAERKILAGIPLSRFNLDSGAYEFCALVAATEITTDQDIETLTSLLREALS